MLSTAVDFLVIGGGVIGVNLALVARQRFPDSRVMLIDKEVDCGLHASGRNSGVLHAGFYYTADSLKARFTRDGNRLLTHYCLDRGLRINRCGKLVVARDTSELDALRELLRRGKANGVELHELTAQEARAIEPRAKTHELALYSPATASVDPREVMAAMLADAKAAGVIIHTETKYLGRDGATIRTNKGSLSAGYVINAAGLYADKIAQDYGFSRDYRILPFKGLYLYSNEPTGSLGTHIYPVPDLRNPFLGVHFTLTVDGKIKIGPTAIPAFWREHYQGLANFNLGELFEITGRELQLWLRDDFNFRRLAWEEIAKYRKTKLVALASGLASNVSTKSYTRWGTPGIRAQLYNVKEHKLEMDFRFEGDGESFHVLNAVSPAFTCALPFTQYLLDEIERLVG